VYYALTSDNWHDFFTEYVPFGEDAVAYFEEREFRKRFLQRPQQSRLHHQVRGEAKVHIPGRAGVSAQPATESKDAAKGPPVSPVAESKAVSPNEPHPETVKSLTAPHTDSKPTGSSTHALLPKDAKPQETKPEAKTAPSTPSPASAPAPTTAAAATPIDSLNVENATEPVVQDVVKILNDIITVVNADNAGPKYSSAVEKAKSDLSKVISDIEILRQKEHKAADDRVSSMQKDFEEAATELLRRQEEQVQMMELRWREEYESERASISKAYDSKLKQELDSANEVYEQKVKNELLKQAISLRREFTDTVKDTVEAERDGRLSKLDELSSSVHELQKLTAQWNSVVESNLQTQRLIVAVEAVKSAIDNAEQPTPFTSELAALKEVAAANPVVDAAIASMNPAAYQRGIPTPAQLIDRFRRVASEVRKASLLPDNAGVASHAASLLLSKVMFKKNGLPVGDDVESILTRAEILLEEGHLEDAVREVNSLSGWAKTLSRDWLAESRRVLEVQQAVDVSTMVLASHD
jgi:mitofilin